MDDDVINQLLLSRAIPGVRFNFIAYVEPEIPGWEGCTTSPQNSWHITKPKILKGLRYTKNRAPRPVTHSLLTYSFLLDTWMLLSPLFHYMETHSTRTLHKLSRICLAYSNDQ